jgi:tetratricopeptide (TPR) repeat protein
LLYKTWFPSTSPYVILLACILFILLPVHVEVVANSKSIDEMLAAGFVSLSLVFVHKRKIHSYLISLLFFLLALLSKISAVTLLPVWIILAFPAFFQWIVQRISWQHVAPVIAAVLISGGFILDLSNYPRPFGIIAACLSIPILLQINSRHVRYFLFFILTILLAQNDRWEFAMLLFMPLFYLDLKDSPPVWELIIKYLLFSFVTTVFDYNSWFESMVFSLFFIFYFFFEKRNEKLLRHQKKILFVFLFYSLVRSLTDSIASFKPLALAMGLMSLLPLLKKKQQNLFVFIIIITSFVSTEYIYNIEDYAINHSVVITADDTETKAAEQTDEIKVLTPYHNVLVESRNQLEKTATICRIQLIYLQKMVFPLALIHQYGTRQIELADWNDWDVYLSILLHLLLLLMAVYFYKKNFPEVTWGIVWYFLTISIYTNIIRLLPDTLAERFLFLPSIGFSIALVSAIYFLIQRIQLNERKSLITLSLLLAPVFAYYTYKTVDRTKDWKSNYTLAANTLPNAENNAAINAQYALELNSLIGTGLFSNADSAEALVVKHYKKAIEIYPDFYGPNADLASYYILNAEPDSAFPYLLESYRIKPEQWLHHYYLGLIYFEKNNYQESFKFFDKIVENELLQADKNEYPELLEAYEFAGRCLHNMGRDQEAYVYLQNGINAYQKKSTYILLANLYRLTGNANLAIQTFENFLVLNPSDQEIINTIEYLKQGLIY